MNTIIFAVASTPYWEAPYGLFFGLLVLGAMLTAGVGVFIFSYYVDDYWADEEYRMKLRRGSKKA